MRRVPERLRARRSGFTLIELLVVITIIAILFALTSAAVLRAISKGDEVRQRNEISQLATAVQSFKTHYQVSILPDTFIARQAYTTTDPYLLYLKSIWPRIGVPQSNGTIAVNWGVLQGLVNSAGAAGVTFRGVECLVLFLGGPDGISGFANNAVDPFNGTNTNRVQPFFEFTPDRLVGSSGQKRSFYDVYGKVPYAYFSSNFAGNDYNDVVLTIGSFSIRPFRVSASRFAAANGFQIISAGKNESFGTGSLNWAGGSGTTPTAGQDDVANFHPTLLGVAP